MQYELLDLLYYSINKHRIKHNLHFWLETNLQKWMYFEPPNSVATAAMQTTDR